MKKYLVIFKSCLAKTLEYRAMLGLWVIFEIISLTTALFMWFAIFRSRTVVGDYNLTTILSYYVLIPIVGSITSSYLTENLPMRIRDGKLSTELMKPYSIAVYNFVDQFAFKMTHLTIKMPIYAVLIIFFTKVFNVELSLLYLGLGLLVSLFAYILNFSIDLILSYAAFWFDDVWFLGHFKTVLLLVFGGLSFPLDLIPERLQMLFNILPFKYFYFFPVKVAQGEISANIFWIEFGTLILWTLWAIVVGKLVWKAGLKRYGAYGN